MKTLNITKHLSYKISWPIKFYNTVCSMFVILGDPGANSGDEEKVKMGGKNSTKKIREEKRFLVEFFAIHSPPLSAHGSLCLGDVKRLDRLADDHNICLLWSEKAIIFTWLPEARLSSNMALGSFIFVILP